MTIFRKEWRLPAGLLFLSLVPIVAGTVRLVQIAAGAPVTDENARFMAAPVPVVLHILCVTIFCLVGSFQFVPSIRLRYPLWHRRAGRLLVLCGLLAALSGLWMTHFYPWPQFDGFILYLVRLLVGTAMALSIVLGFATIRRKDRQRHRVWMMRGFALGLGAGTQVFTHIPWALLPQYHSEIFRTICMTAGWCINLGVVEWILFRERMLIEGRIRSGD